MHTRQERTLSGLVVFLPLMRDLDVHIEQVHGGNQVVFGLSLKVLLLELSDDDAIGEQPDSHVDQLPTLLLQVLRDGANIGTLHISSVVGPIE